MRRFILLLLFDLIVSLYDLLQYLVVPGKGPLHRARASLPELGGTLDVGEQEGDGARGWAPHKLSRKLTVGHAGVKQRHFAILGNPPYSTANHSG
jgi:hypothetical protein